MEGEDYREACQRRRGWCLMFSLSNYRRERRFFDMYVYLIVRCQMLARQVYHKSYLLREVGEGRQVIEKQQEIKERSLHGKQERLSPPAWFVVHPLIPPPKKTQKTACSSKQAPAVSFLRNFFSHRGIPLPKIYFLCEFLSRISYLWEFFSSKVLSLAGNFYPSTFQFLFLLLFSPLV